MSPTSRAEILDAIRTVDSTSVTYWNLFTTSEFLQTIGDAWSPAQNVRHLTKSMRAVTRGLNMPRLGLRVMFGKADGVSRSYEEMRHTYRAELAKGATAGAFTPSERGTPADAEAERVRIMREHALMLNEFCSTIEGWEDEDLDVYRLPHPLLGPITIREMLLFTVYHNQHHVDTVQRLKTAQTS